MAVHHGTWDHRLFILVAVATHATVGYAVGALLGRPRWGALGGVLPDVDLAFAPDWTFPFVHRGVTHTPLFVGLAAAALAAGARAGRTDGRLAGAALGAGALSHLLVDSLTDVGVPWLYPATAARYGLALDVHDTAGTVALLALAAALLVVSRRAAA